MWDRIEGNWERFRDHARHEWARLSDGELDEIDGRRDRLARRVRDTYGVSEEEADKQVAAWEAEMRRRDADGRAAAERGTPVLDNDGPESGENDRPGGAGMPSNQGGGREPTDGSVGRGRG